MVPTEYKPPLDARAAPGVRVGRTPTGPHVCENLDAGMVCAAAYLLESPEAAAAGRLGDERWYSGDLSAAAQ